MGDMFIYLRNFFQATGTSTGPESINPQVQPVSFFQLFFTNSEFDNLATNTNAYAESKGAGIRGRK